MDASMTKRDKRPRLDGEIRKYCFSDVFNNLSPVQLLAIQQLYSEGCGALPARRLLGQAAKRIGISQARIRKWFEEQKLLESSVRPTSPAGCTCHQAFAQMRAGRVGEERVATIILRIHRVLSTKIAADVTHIDTILASLSPHHPTTPYDSSTTL